MQTEIDAALEGRYEFDRVFLEEAMVVDEPYVSVDDTYYDLSVTVGIVDRVSHVRRIVDEYLACRSEAIVESRHFTTVSHTR